MNTIHLHRNQLAELIFMSAILFGVFMRFNPTLLAGSVIYQGGMFAVMVDDLRANHYLLPMYTSYNHLEIPFAYPPLGFYLGGIMADLIEMDSVQVVRWLPAFFASLSIPAFYLLALRLLKNKYYASVSTLFFALMPRALSWYISGSGLTRSPGQIFMLLTLAASIRLYQEKRRSDLIWAGLFAGLTILSHPEAAVHMVASVVFLWIMLGRSRSSFIHSIGLGATALLITAPWWATVIHYHGLEPLLNAAQTGQKSSAVLHLLFFDFTEEPYATLIAVLGLIGVASRRIRRDYLLPLWIALPFLVEGRSAILPAAIPLAMLAAIGLVDVVMNSLSHKVGPEQAQFNQVSKIEFGILVYFLLYLVFSTYQYGFQLAKAALSAANRDAMHWVQRNTLAGSRFLVLTGTNSISCDAILEWFPALTDRHSLFTVQ
ncbi:MAG: glycosyltransferase family 39 protein [Chloroflexota bacterium]